MKYTFIVNSKSRSGRGGMIWDLLEPALKKSRTDYEVFYTKFAGHAARIAADITADGLEHTLVVVGGDGTVNEVINGLSYYAKVTLGYIPVGSGNDFTRALHLPSDPQKALENVLHPGRRVPMDVGRVCCGGRDFRFAVSAGIGFDAAVCHQAAVSKVKVVLNRLGLGKLTYLAIALKSLLAERPLPAELIIDGGTVKRFASTYFVAIMNHPYEGGGFCFCPQAEIGDGFLDVIVAHDLPKWKILLLLPTAFYGKHVKYKGISIYRGREIAVKMKKRLPVHTDGEPVAAEASIKAEPEPERLMVLAPAEI